MKLFLLYVDLFLLFLYDVSNQGGVFPYGYQ
nr:MAG TPA: hypothetical protein [Caudoviricetes sp.]